MSILDEVNAEVGNMDTEAVKAELAKLLTQKKAQVEKQKARNLDPANKEKRQQYSKQYREQVMSDPEKAAKVIERRKAYMGKPETKERMKAYRTKRNERIKALEAKAKELGIDINSLVAAAQ